MFDKVAFAKFQGAGNDFVIVEARRGVLGEEPDLPALARRLCDRHYGVGADGLLVAADVTQRGAAGRMRMFNPDGSESEMCGNGLRCFVRWLADSGELTGDTASIQTGAGLLKIERHADGAISAWMGEPQIKGRDQSLSPCVPGVEWPATVVSMGNPHAAFLVTDVAAVPLEEVGPRVERHPAFPQRTNVEFVQALAPDRLRVRVWERGAGATLACGTGACAAHAAARVAGVAAERAALELPGGTLTVSWSGPGHQSILTGAAARVFDGAFLYG